MKLQKESKVENVLSVPCSRAVIVNESDSHVLFRKSNAVLDALYRIRQIEEKSGNIGRVKELDRQITKKQQKLSMQS